MTAGGPPDNTFEAAFRQVFADRFASLFRYLDRLCGDPALAADVAQETFVRLYRRGEMPDDARSWLVSVANNLFRDERRRVSRRRRLLDSRPADLVLGDAPPAADAGLLAEERRRAVRATLDGMSERDRMLLLLQQEGYSYREIAAAAQVAETSVGTLLARAKAAFRSAFDERSRAPE